MPKSTYRTFTKTIKLSFYTSSVDKLLQARLVFSGHGHVLGFYRAHREPYEEDYSSTTENLLRNAIKSIQNEYGFSGPFFVEDTSIRIEALSDSNDVPGMRAKEWFSETSFFELNAELQARGNNRDAMVKSDIALHVPGYAEPVFFHGETYGYVANSEPDFEESVAYPWLTPRTFNGWFIPHNQGPHSQRLGEMEYEKSLDFDFRVRSLEKLVAFYEQLNAAINLPPALVDARTRPSVAETQLAFFLRPNVPVICVVGDKCAGKTTFANILVKELDAVHIEASSLFGEICEESDQNFESDIDVLSFLETHNYDIVARRVMDRIVESDKLIIVTGLRTPEELLLINKHIESVVFLFINTEQRIRYERHLNRSRDQHLKSFPEFRDRDEMQRQFGVLRLPNDIAASSIDNDGPMHELAVKSVEFANEVLRGRRPVHLAGETEAFRSLRALLEIGRAATCEEISNKTADLGSRVRLYNTNRALKQLPEFARRLQPKNGKIAYEPTHRTRALVELIVSARRDETRQTL